MGKEPTYEGLTLEFQVLLDQSVLPYEELKKLVGKYSKTADTDAPDQGAKEENRIVIPAPGEIFEITVDKGVDEYKQDGGPWWYFNDKVTSKNFPRQSQEARVIRACFVEGVDLKPRQGLVYRSVAKEKFQISTPKKRFPYADEAMAVIAKFKKLGIDTSWMAAFIKGSDYAFIVDRYGDERDLRLSSGERWFGGGLFLAVCE